MLKNDRIAVSDEKMTAAARRYLETSDGGDGTEERKTAVHCPLNATINVKARWHDHELVAPSVEKQEASFGAALICRFMLHDSRAWSCIARHK